MRILRSSADMARNLGTTHELNEAKLFANGLLCILLFGGVASVIIDSKVRAHKVGSVIAIE